MLSRQLVLPGELRAMTHLGCTLARHCLQASLRYGRYHLGLAVPTVTKVPIVHLRPYFEGDPRDPFDDLILDPGADAAPSLAPRVAAALRFHALRLRLLPRRTPAAHEIGTGTQSWPALRPRISDWVPLLGDALLMDLAGVRKRRRARSRGKTRPPCSSPRTTRWLAAPEPPTMDVGVAGRECDIDPASLPDPDPPRGALRDAWLTAVADLRPRLREFGLEAERCGLISAPDDIFFLPFDHLDVLAGERAPQWLASAIDANRGEWSALAESEAPPERLEEPTAGLRWRRNGRERPIPTVITPLA